MEEPVTITDLKVQLRLEIADTNEDGFLASLIVTARRTIERLTNQNIVGETPSLPESDRPLALQAILSLAAYLYDDRGAEGGIPHAISDLVAPLRRWML